jgi:hypothetical protein
MTAAPAPVVVRLNFWDVALHGAAGFLKDVRAVADAWKPGDRRDDARGTLDHVVGAIAEAAVDRVCPPTNWRPSFMPNGRTHDVAGWEVKGTLTRRKPGRPGARLLVRRENGNPRCGKRYVLVIGLDDNGDDVGAANFYDWRIVGWIDGREIMAHEFGVGRGWTDRPPYDSRQWFREPAPDSGRPPCFCVPQSALHGWTGDAAAGDATVAHPAGNGNGGAP